MTTPKITGIVEHGRGIGQTLDFPTANILFEGQLELENGIYFATASVVNNQYYALVNIGIRPTFDDGLDVKVEAFLIDFDGDIYGQQIELQILQYIRPEQRFDNAHHLRLQMMRDLELAKTLIISKQYE